MATNKVELRGQLLGDPELRITPAGTAILRFTVDCAERKGDLSLSVVITGEDAVRLKAQLKRGNEVRVEGTLKPVRHKLSSGIVETALEVIARSISPD